MGRDLQAKISQESLHVLSFSLNMARVKGECIGNNFCSGNVKQYLKQEFIMRITPGSTQCVFLNTVP